MTKFTDWSGKGKRVGPRAEVVHPRPKVLPVPVAVKRFPDAPLYHRSPPPLSPPIYAISYRSRPSQPSSSLNPPKPRAKATHKGKKKLFSVNNVGPNGPLQSTGNETYGQAVHPKTTPPMKGPSTGVVKTPNYPHEVIDPQKAVSKAINRRLSAKRGRSPPPLVTAAPTANKNKRRKRVWKKVQRPNDGPTTERGPQGHGATTPLASSTAAESSLDPESALAASSNEIAIHELERVLLFRAGPTQPQTPSTLIRPQSPLPPPILSPDGLFFRQSHPWTPLFPHTSPMGGSSGHWASNSGLQSPRDDLPSLNASFLTPLRMQNVTSPTSGSNPLFSMSHLGSGQMLISPVGGQFGTAYPVSPLPHASATVLPMTELSSHRIRPVTTDRSLESSEESVALQSSLVRLSPPSSKILESLDSQERNGGQSCVHEEIQKAAE